MERPKNILLVQARNGSTRFPKKMTQEFGHTSLLGFVLDNLISWRNTDRVVLATSINPQDDELASIAESHSVDVFRGDEKNVAHRLVSAGNVIAENEKNARFFRVCADNPYLCEDLFDELLFVLDTVPPLDYLSHRVNGTPAILTDFGVFVEYFNLKTLKSRLTRLTQIEQEHATLTFFKGLTNNNAFFIDLDWPLDNRIRLTCDTPQDYRTLQEYWNQVTLPINLEKIGKMADSFAEQTLLSMSQETGRNSKS